MKTKITLIGLSLFYFFSCIQGFDNNRIIKYEEPETPDVTYTIKVDTTVGGTVSIDPQRETYAQEEQIKLTAQPAAGYSFSRWTGTTNSTENPLLFSAQKNEWIIPVFTLDDMPPEGPAYTIKVDTSIGGTVSIDPEKETYAQDEYIKLTALPSQGYSFSRWTGTTNSTENPLLFSVQKNEWIIPIFTLNDAPP
jgi:hypothetical protein